MIPIEIEIHQHYQCFFVMYYLTNAIKNFKLPFTSIEIAKTNRPCGLEQNET